MVLVLLQGAGLVPRLFTEIWPLARLSTDELGLRCVPLLQPFCRLLSIRLRLHLQAEARGQDFQERARRRSSSVGSVPPAAWSAFKIIVPEDNLGLRAIKRGSCLHAAALDLVSQCKAPSIAAREGWYHQVSPDLCPVERGAVFEGQLCGSMQRVLNP